MKLYMNGKEVASLEGSFAPMTRSEEPLCVGADPKGANRFTGRILRAAVYRRALTASEVAHPAASTEPPSLDGVLGEWEFEPAREAHHQTRGRYAVLQQTVLDGVRGETRGEASPPEQVRRASGIAGPRWSGTKPLAVGNGRLGAMVFGGVARERLQLNEDTFWAGSPYDPAHADAIPYLAEARPA